VGICVKCESKSGFLKPKTFVPMIADLDHILDHAKIKRLMDLGPIDMPRQLVHDDQLTMLMNNLLAYCEYI